jgi:glycerol kinase
MQTLTCMRVDGGMSVNELLLQSLADILNAKIVRSEIVEATSWGAAVVAGLAVGVWKDLDEVKKLRRDGMVKEPKDDKLRMEYPMWKKATERSLNWVEWSLETGFLEVGENGTYQRVTIEVKNAGVRFFVCR